MFNESWKRFTILISVFFVIIVNLSLIPSFFEPSELVVRLIGKEIVFLSPIIFVGVLLITYTMSSSSLIKKCFVSNKSNTLRKSTLIVVVSLVLIISMAALTAFQLRMLIIGNKYQYSRIHGEYLVLAQQQFDDLDLDEALKTVRRCYEITSHYRCLSVIKSIDERIKFKEELKSISDDVVLSMEGTLRLLHDISLFTNDNSAVVDFTSSVTKRHEKASDIYKKALQAILNEDFSLGINLLNEVEATWNDFGHNQFLLNEINQLLNKPSLVENKDSITINFYYFSELKRLGVDAYASKTIYSSTYPFLKLAETYQDSSGD